MVMAVAAGGIGHRVIAADAGKTGTDKSQEQTGTMEEHTGDTFSEEGTTQIQTESQQLSFAVNAVTMTVEEVYVEAGTAVEEGDALLKISDESMSEAISYYEDAVADAQKELEKAQLEFSEGVLEAESELKNTRIEAEHAGDVYEASLSELAVNVEEKKEAYENAVAEIREYQEAIDNGTYYVQVGIDEKQETVNAAEASVTETQEQLNSAQSSYDAVQQVLAANLENLKKGINDHTSYEELLSLAEQVESDYIAVQTATVNLSQAQTTADNAWSSLESANQRMENAVKEYNSCVEEANQKITELTESLEELSKAYEEAQREAVTQEAEIQKVYDEAVLEGKYADTEYEAALAGLQTAVDTAQDTLDTLVGEQTALLAITGGVICADRAGTVASVSYEAEDVLRENVALASYYDTSTIFISVEVSQEQIAELAVGEEVEVMITGNRNGAVTGKISSIASQKTTGGSMSNVTYAVVIAINNADGRISSGSSATVTFQCGEERAAASRTEATPINGQEETEKTEKTGETEGVEETGGTE